MPSRFPFLKSQTDAYGLIEQFGIAVTVDPDSDPAAAASNSWFGRLLDPNAASLTYTGATGTPDTIAGYTNLTNAYGKGDLRYTAYDWRITLLKLDLTAMTGEVEGAVTIKGKCKTCTNNADHGGEHTFRYVIVRDASKNWRIKEWTLKKITTTPGVPNPLVEFLRENF